MLWEIRATAGRYAVVGIPCFIKAIHLLRRIDPLIRERVTHTLGLFYGHMKSAAMVESFAWQLDTELRQVRALDYRIKDQNRPANWYRAHLDLQEGETAEQDWWHLADGDWGAGFFQIQLATGATTSLLRPPTLRSAMPGSNPIRRTAEEPT